MSRVDSISESRPRATPKITVRIDRGEEFVEMCGDWQGETSIGQDGNVREWLDYDLLYQAFLKLNKAVME